MRRFFGSRQITNLRYQAAPCAKHIQTWKLSPPLRARRNRVLASGSGCVTLAAETKSDCMRAHKSENRSATPLLRFRILLAASLILFLAAQDIRAAEKSLPLKKQKEKPAPEARLFHDNSVEALTESARHSVVVVSHEGRDGKEGGVGSGFIVSSNGLIATSLHVIGEARPITVHLANDATMLFAGVVH